MEDCFTETAEALNTLRLEGKLCDAVLVVNGRQFPVHRAIMAAISPYFKALFTNGLKETDKSEIIIPDMPEEVLENIVEYAYTRKVKVSSGNVEILLPYAEQFHINGITNACCNFLENQLMPENCVGIYKFADAFFLTCLRDKARRFITHHFQTVGYQSSELLQLDIKDICSILSDDYLNTRFEEDVFNIAKRWVEFDLQNRSKHLPVLLHCVRFGLIHLDFFKPQIHDCSLVKNNSECAAIIKDAWDFLTALEQDESKRHDLRNPHVRPRIPHEVIFATGGWTGGSPTTFLESYDTRADRWFSQPFVADKTPRAYHGCVELKGLVYVLGGFDGTTYFNSVRAFNPVTKLWHEVAPMYKQRCYVSTTVADGSIYACGGFDGRERLQSAEKYSPSANQWTCLPDMLRRRSDANAAFCAGKIFVCGGFDGQECLDTAEVFELSTEQWSVIPPMRERRSGVSLVSYRGNVHALGGFNGWHRLACGERYDHATKRWVPIQKMFTARSNFSCVVMDNMIFAIGGFNGTTTVAHVECYDGDVDDWYDATDMNINRSALAACIVHDLPNMRDYTYYGHINTTEGEVPLTQAETCTSKPCDQNSNNC